jgi:hypothetical protein
LACDEVFFNGLQGAIRTLDTYWPDHDIIVYDMGHSPQQRELVGNDLFYSYTTICFIVCSLAENKV